MSAEQNHLYRLEKVWLTNPIYFVTTCTQGHTNRLANSAFHELAIEVWRNCEALYGWATGRYVLMPDHVHYFTTDIRGERSLSEAVGKWKEWTAKYAARRLGFAMPLWQREFFDHALRSSESYSQKWTYTRDNPVRAGLATTPEDWPYQGELSSIRCD